jgi:hypothetical protein
MNQTKSSPRRLSSDLRDLSTGHPKPTTCLPQQKSNQQTKKKIHQQNAPKRPPTTRISTTASTKMGRAPDLHHHKPDAQRLPTLHPQSTPTAPLLGLIRLRRPGVHFCLLGQALPVAHWRATARSFSKSRHHVLGAGAGGELVAMSEVGGSVVVV